MVSYAGSKRAAASQASGSRRKRGQVEQEPELELEHESEHESEHDEPTQAESSAAAARKSRGGMTDTVGFLSAIRTQLTGISK